MASLQILCINDLETLASEKLDKMTREYFNCGADDEITLKDNIDSFNRYKLRPRALKDVSKIDTSTNLWGRKIKLPLCVGPAAMQKLAHPVGEVGTSRAAAGFGVPMCLSSFSTYSLEDVYTAGARRIDYVIQLYVLTNRVLSEALVRRAERAGYKAIFLTVDTPFLGKRRNEVRNSFRLPSHLQLLNFGPGEGVKTLPDYNTENAAKTKEAIDQGIAPEVMLSEGNVNDPSLNWAKDIPWLRSITNLEIWVKGILTAEDTLLAIQHGVDGIVVSNHGGRQLDTVVSTLDALPECVEAVAGRIPVHIDGGIRRGTDIFKALALGAQCCWIGRIPLWGLAYNGEKGVDLALQILYEEFRLCMGLAGCKDVSEIGKEHLARIGLDGRLSRL